MINIDSGKCIGCRKGVYPWQKNKDGDYEHIDLFATQTAGAIYKCANSKEIEPYLYERADSKGVYRPNEELEDFLNQEDFWFEDIVNLAHRIFDDWEKVKEFFDMGEEGDKNWQLPKEELEGALYAMAKAVNIEVTEEEYPDFAMWKKKNIKIMEILESIRQDLKKSLAFSEEPGVLGSIMAHLEEQCTKDEQAMIEERIMDLPLKEYESYSEFIEEYQPIFDLVDFPIAQCVKHFDKRKFSEEDLDRLISKNNN